MTEKNKKVLAFHKEGVYTRKSNAMEERTEKIALIKKIKKVIDRKV